MAYQTLKPCYGYTSIQKHLQKEGMSGKIGKKLRDCRTTYEG
jgi:hypothetical protein